MASSEARVAANRRNALKSTGPVTEAGKHRSRANALKHGLCGDGVVLAAGDGPAVDAEVAGLRALRRAVDDEANAADRAEASARALFDEAASGRRARRYEAAAERSLFRALRELREARAGAARVAPDVPKPEPVVEPPPPRPSAPAPGPGPRREPEAPAPVWPDWLEMDDVNVPLAIGRAATPGRTNPRFAAQSNTSRR